jgi:hypothetical protein
MVKPFQQFAPVELGLGQVLDLVVEHTHQILRKQAELLVQELVDGRHSQPTTAKRWAWEARDITSQENIRLAGDRCAECTQSSGSFPGMPLTRC